MEPTVYGDRGPWAAKLREYTLWIVQRRKSSLPMTRAQDIFVTGRVLLRDPASCIWLSFVLDMKYP